VAFQKKINLPQELGGNRSAGEVHE
jgi:hypothetical protein